VLTIGELREALKPKYYGDIRYKPVEGAPPEGRIKKRTGAMIWILFIYKADNKAKE
jgi:hypothetical protein